MDLDKMTIMAVLLYSYECQEPVILNGRLVLVKELSPLFEMGIPQFEDSDGNKITVRRSDDVRIP